VEDPDYIMWDEPTTGLDPITNNMVHDMIREARDELGVTSMVISHDIEGTMEVSDCIAILYRGKIIQEGSPEDIRRSENPIVRQLISGSLTGPITEDDERYRTDKAPVGSAAQAPSESEGAPEGDEAPDAGAEQSDADGPDAEAS
jgi:ABC-type transporter Mla maintaining outer membrane lipid asymmetry ATPase subunit MlaF